MHTSDEYYVSCFKDKLILPELSSTQEQDLFGHIEANFNVILRPWLSTCGFPKEKINFLEIGCGDGKYGHFIAPNVCTYTGLDLRDVSIKSARLLLAQHGNCKIIGGNGREFIGIPDRSMQLIFSYHTFMVMPDKDVILSNLKEIIRVLADEGEARVQILGPAFKPGWRVVWRKLRSYDPFDGSARKSGILGKVIRTLQWALPGDFLIPSLRKKPYISTWGIYGGWLHPLEAQDFVRSLGASAWVVPSTYGPPYMGYDHSFYWLVISRGRKSPPYFLSLS